MSKAISFKTKDICDALNIERHQLRVWVDSIPLLSNRKTRERSASQYKIADLFFLAVVKHIHQSFGVPISFIANFADSLYSCVLNAEGDTKVSFVFISHEGTCELRQPKEVDKEGLIVSLQPARKLLLSYLGVSMNHAQMVLNLTEDMRNVS